MISPLIRIVNALPNLYFFTASAEDLKTQLVASSKGSAPVLDSAHMQNAITMLAAIDYVEKTADEALAVAKELDAKIVEIFPKVVNKGGAEKIWRRLLAYAAVQKPALVASVEDMVLKVCVTSTSLSLLLRMLNDLDRRHHRTNEVDGTVSVDDAQ